MKLPASSRTDWSLALASGPRSFFPFFEKRKLNFLFHRIDPIHDHPHFLSHTESLARALANDLARVLVISVMIVGQSGEGDESFYEHVRELDEGAVFGDANDEAIEIFADTVLHEFCFLPFHQLAFSVIGPAFGLAGFFGDRVQLLQRDRTVGNRDGITFTTLGPG